MKPILKQTQGKKYIWILYTIIFIICIVGVCVAVYFNFYKEESVIRNSRY